MADLSYLDSPTRAGIDELLARQPAEGRDLEYKRELPGETREAKKEFLADVISFANTAGGHLIFGVEEEAGLPVAAPGCRLEDLDFLRQRLENLIRDGASPIIRGLEISAAQVGDQRYVVVIRIPRSYLRPHMISLGGDFRFYCRNSAGKYPVDVGELRRLFLESDTLAKEIEHFRVDRLSRIILGDVGFDLGEAPKIVLHLMPFVAFDLTPGFDLDRVASQRQLMEPMHGSATNYRYTVDGYLARSNDYESGTSISYLIVFRNGCIEAVESFLLQKQNDHRLIPSTSLETILVRAFGKYLEIYRRLEVPPPIAVALSLVGVKGYRMAAGDVVPRIPQDEIDRDTVSIPPIVLNELTLEPAAALRPLLDGVWNAAGWPGSPHYDAEGRWQLG